MGVFHIYPIAVSINIIVTFCLKILLEAVASTGCLCYTTYKFFGCVQMCADYAQRRRKYGAS